MTSDTNGPGRATKTGGDDLRTAISLLPTPMADRSGNNRGGSGGRDDPDPVRPSLDSVHALLPTPRATDIGTPGRRSSEGWRPQLGQAVIETWGKYAEAVALWGTIIGRPAPAPTEPGKNGPRLAAALPEWMMGLPEGYLTGHLSRSAALKAAGNGAAPLQAAAAQERLAG